MSANSTCGANMIKKRSITEASSDLPGLVRDAEARKTFAESYAEFTRTFDLRELAIDTDQVFGSIRDMSRGRVVDP